MPSVNFLPIFVLFIIFMLIGFTNERRKHLDRFTLNLIVVFVLDHYNNFLVYFTLNGPLQFKELRFKFVENNILKPSCRSVLSAVPTQLLFCYWFKVTLQFLVPILIKTLFLLLWNIFKAQFNCLTGFKHNLTLFKQI